MTQIQTRNRLPGRSRVHRAITFNVSSTAKQKEMLLKEPCTTPDQYKRFVKSYLLCHRFYKVFKCNNITSMFTHSWVAFIPTSHWFTCFFSKWGPIAAAMFQAIVIFLPVPSHFCFHSTSGLQSGEITPAELRKGGWGQRNGIRPPLPSLCSP
uniref:Uncharacterized protein n=1 Tax=Anguilla anguilla TaxID=7936 RepID=A0A0E9WUC1_ANGAN